MPCHDDVIASSDHLIPASRHPLALSLALSLAYPIRTRTRTHAHVGTQVLVSIQGLLNPEPETLNQVLVSIQGLVLVSEPYYNEAGYEKQMGTLEGRHNSKQVPSAFCACMCAMCVCHVCVPCVCHSARVCVPCVCDSARVCVPCVHAMCETS
jgi:hypothetical protein